MQTFLLRFVAGALSLVLVALLIGCGGGNTGSTNNNQELLPPPNPTLSFAYLTAASNGRFQIMHGSFDGDRFFLGGQPAFADFSSITLSGDNTKLAFSEWGGVGTNTQWDIYVSALDGDPFSWEAVTNDEAIDFYPSFSPDGRKVMFSSHRTEGSGGDIIVFDVTGGQATNLTNGGTLDRAHPVFSPDGQKIAFAAYEAATDTVDVWLMNADGSNVTKLTTSVDFSRDWNAYPSFSPDGKQVIFTHGDSTSGANIFSINVDGSGMKPLTTSGLDWDPFFISNGKVVFVSLRDGNMEIYSMKADGSVQTRLTNNSVYDAFTTDMLFGLPTYQNSFVIQLQNRTTLWRSR